MPSILITGTRRGIGLELVKQFAEQGWRVYACARSPENSPELLELVDQHDSVSAHMLDVTNTAQLMALAEELEGQSIDVLLNNAGVYGGLPQSFDEIDVDDWLSTFHVNTIAPAMVMKAFRNHVAAGENKIMASISSKMASIDDNGSGGSYVYRSSKTALNSVVKSAANDLADEGITAVALHPGWVRTDMGGPNGEMSVEESAAALIKILCELNHADTGRFIDIDGSTIPW